jgi:hypothetical protein
VPLLDVAMWHRSGERRDAAQLVLVDEMVATEEPRGGLDAGLTADV